LGVEERNNNSVIKPVNIKAYPNPTNNLIRFEFSLPAGIEYKIDIYDISGRNVQTIKGLGQNNNQPVQWDIRNDHIKSGVYFYKFASSVFSTSGKIIVQ
jgi:hypothetical protein